MGRIVIILLLFCYFNLSAQQSTEGISKSPRGISIDFHATSSLYSTYKDWANNYQLGARCSLRFHPSGLSSKKWSAHAYILEVGLYYHEYFVPNAYINLGYQVGRETAAWSYHFMSALGLGRARLTDERYHVVEGQLVPAGPLDRWHFQPTAGFNIGWKIGRKKRLQIIPNTSLRLIWLTPYMTELQQKISKLTFGASVGLQFRLTGK